MRRNNLLSAFYVIFISFLMLSCSDDNDSDYEVFPGGTSAKILPVKVTGDKNATIIYYEYDNNNRLVTIKREWPRAGEGSTNTISYDTEGRIVKLTRTHTTPENNYIWTYTYNGSQITAKYDKSAHSFIIEVNESGHILKRDQLDVDGNVVYSEYFVYDDNGNIKNKNTSHPNYRSYTYDDKNGIFKNVNIPQWFLATQLSELYTFDNNVVEESVKYSNGEIEERLLVDSGFKIAYTYNGNDYPIKYTSPYRTDIVGEIIDDTFTIKYRLAK